MFEMNMRPYETVRAEVDRMMTDKLGMPIDKGVRELVTALRMFGVRTTMSCHGHAHRRGSYPWVRVDSTDAYLLTRLTALQNRPMLSRGVVNKNIWIIMPSLGLTLMPLDRNRGLREMRADADAFAAHLRMWAKMKRR